MSIVRSIFRLTKPCMYFSPVILLRSAMSSTASELLNTKHVGFLGSGKISQAMVKGFLAGGVLKGGQVTMTDVFGTSLDDAHYYAPIKELEETYGIEYMQTNEVMAQKSDIIFACVKPHLICPILERLSTALDDKLLISVAAGVTLDQLRQVVPESTRLIRVMPNTPCLVGAGTAIFSNGSKTSAEDIQLTKVLCSSVFPIFEEIPENLINAATGICGCGPAYMYLIVEALTDGGVRVGIPRQLAQKLAIGTMVGSAEMMAKTGEEPAKLRGDVCSPGGVTIAAVHALELGGLRATLMNAVQAAVIRSKEMEP